jgi:hypothetical protein
MPASPHPLYAVCPHIGRGRATEVPKLFKSASAAKRFLNPLMAAEASSELQARRRQATIDLAGAASKIRPRVLDLSAAPSQSLVDKSGWRELPVPVYYLADHIGARCVRSVREYVSAERVGDIPGFTLNEEFARAVQDRTGEYRSFLGEDWSFSEIEADAEQRSGHEYAAIRYGSFAQIVADVILDLEAALLRLHRDLSHRQVEIFWTSYQVHRHVADFCARLAKSGKAELLAGASISAEEAVERARIHLMRRIAVFTHELWDDVEPSQRGNSDDTPTPRVRREPDSISGTADSVQALGPERGLVSESRYTEMRAYKAEYRLTHRENVTYPLIAHHANKAWNDSTMVRRFLANDPRCEPSHARKIEAVLRERPVPRLPIAVSPNVK